MESGSTQALLVDEAAARARAAASETAAARLDFNALERDAAAARRAAQRSRLPHLPAWRSLLSGHFRDDQAGARERAAAADGALAASRQRLRRAELDEGLAAARLATLTKQAAAERAAAVAAAVEQVLAGGGVDAERMVGHVDVIESCAAQLVEVAEAARAVAAARAAADAAARELDRAKSWGTYDTWFGGGILSSAIKHDRIDSASSAMARVHSSLATARKELADVSVEIAAPDLSTVGKHRTMDIWFDNIFSDLGTQSRIADGRQRCAGCAPSWPGSMTGWCACVRT